MLIDHTSQFDADNIDAQVVGIAAELGLHDSGMHTHRKAQLLYSAQGCITVTTEGSQCILPPTRAMWIPAGQKHSAKMRNVVAYRSLYFDTQRLGSLPEELKVIAVNPLFKQLIERISYWDWQMPAKSQTNVLALFFDELRQAPDEMLQLTIPKDPRLAVWVAQVAAGDMQPQALNKMALAIGASEKTISRIFIKETGMAYQAWRQQWRLHRAIEYLAEGLSITQLASLLDFASDSAFISFFKQQLGETPSQFIKSKAG
ncbi:helix-turn-helix transcriptional regulator [Shewanella sp. UCD-KL12]|uniref:AraC family transcriptional regulator n=1 Tax=Shewanella sp. UCD-KL12 TaxID=1917163 RepID=UPI00097130C1|nr:helix-turn-helix transcriptional regulator [Shewanella sp. UCD-KL12]